MEVLSWLSLYKTSCLGIYSDNDGNAITYGGVGLFYHILARALTQFGAVTELVSMGRVLQAQPQLIEHTTPYIGSHHRAWRMHAHNLVAQP